MVRDLHVTVAQSPGGLDGSEARLNWLSDNLDQHAKCDLLVLPELFQSGYGIGDQVTLRAEASGGPFAQAVGALAQRHSTAILYGYAEQDGGAIYNAAQCIDKAGVRIGHHRKLLLPPGFEGDHFSSAAQCELFTLQGFKVAILICYDVEFPENLRHVAQMGADLVAVPTALGAQWGVVSEKLIPARAFENGVFLAYANHCEREKNIQYFGGSCILAPDGAQLARAGQGPQNISAVLRHAARVKAQARLPYLHDCRKLPWAFDRDP